MSVPIEEVTVVLGRPKDPDQDEIPATIFDVEQKRVRYQYITKREAQFISNTGASHARWNAKFKANYWFLQSPIIA